MIKKSILLSLILLLSISITTFAVTGMDFLENSSLLETNNYDCKALSIIIKALTANGQNTDIYRSKLLAAVSKQGVEAHAYALLATFNPDMATELTAKQQNGGSWNDDIYLTSLSTYALLATDQQFTNALSGIDYISSNQNEDGGWGVNGQSTPLTTIFAVAALKKANSYNDITQKGLQWLLLHQGSEGGWGNNINTAWACLALHELGTNPDELEKAVDYLKMFINKDGGWGIYPGEASDPFTSALVLLALHKYDSTLPEVAKGLAYLQKLIEDEAWINKALAYYNISEISHLLWDDPEFDSTKESYLSFLKDFPDQQNYDYLARKISLMAKTGEDVADFITQLLTGQNSDGGWGFGPGYSSDPLDTALALRALLDSGYADFTSYQKIVAYFYSQQNSDGSFSIKKNSDGQVYLTALIVEELERLKKVYDCSNLYGSARQWLINQHNIDGSYGNGILETARVFMVIFNLLNSEQVNDTLTFINTNKLANGSWGNDSLTTATVMAALSKISSNLTVSTTDVVITPTPVYLNDQVTINVTVKNTGFNTLNNFKVNLYRENTVSENLLETKMIQSIQAKESIVLTFSWIATCSGPNEFIVLLDPENVIDESNENDNQIVKTLQVLARVDLAIDDTDITILPEDPGPTDQLIIKAKVHNYGSKTSEAFNIAIYNGDPNNGGIIINNINCPGILGGGTSEVVSNIQLGEGNFSIHVILDPDNLVPEDLKNNNKVIHNIEVKKRYDLVVGNNSITYSKEDPIESESITIKTTILNHREAVTNVPVSFYLDDPAQGGTFLEKVIIDSIEANSSATASIDWDTTDVNKDHFIYILVDPDNQISETNETNNIAFSPIFITPRPDLVASITYYGTIIEGQPADISIRVTNLGLYTIHQPKVLVYLDGLSESNRISEDIVVTEYYNNSGHLKYMLETLNLSGTHTIYVKVDPLNEFYEINEDNNTASYQFTINPAPELEIRPEEVSITPTEISEGSIATFNIPIHNLTSDSEVQNVPIRLYIQENNQWVTQAEQKINIINSKEVKFKWDSYQHIGFNQFKIIVDPDYLYYEQNKDNNVVFKEVEVKPALYADLTVNSNSIKIIPDSVAKGTSGILQAEIKNLSPVSAQNILIRFYDGDPANGGLQIGNDQFINISGRETVTTETNWDTVADDAFHQIFVWANPENATPEQYLDNNLASNTVILRATVDYQPKNLNTEIVYHDVRLNWYPVQQNDLVGYMVYQDNLPAIELTDLTRGSVKASSEQIIWGYGYKATLAIDGYPSTYWKSVKNAEPYWIEEEFSEWQYLQEIEIEWDEASIPLEYQIQVWDGKEYCSILHITDNNLQITSHRIGNGFPIKRYRIYITKTIGDYIGIKEFRIKGYKMILTNSFTDINVPSGNYKYSVTALNSLGEESLPCEATVAISPPAEPVGFKANVQGCDVNLNWQKKPSENIIGYYLRRNEKLLGKEEIVSGIATASSSHNDYYSPDKAIDGDTTTHWFSVLSEQVWWQIDFQEKCYLKALDIKWSYLPSDYQIFIWHNDWVLVKVVKDNNESEVQYDFGESLKTDKVRINFSKSSSGYVGAYEFTPHVQRRITELGYFDQTLKVGNYSYSLTAENSLFNESIPITTEAVINPPAKPENVKAEIENNNVSLSWLHQQSPSLLGYLVYRNNTVINRSISEDIAISGIPLASTSYPVSIYDPSKALDRNPSYYWLSDGDIPAWYQVEFEKFKVIAGLKLNWNSSFIGRNYQIQYFEDDTWKTICSIYDNTKIDVEHYFVKPVYTDRIRVLMTESNSNSNRFGIAEIYIYENIMSKQLSFIDQNLLNGEYEYKVIAVDAAWNHSESSDPVQMTVGDIPVPIKLKADVNQSTVNLQWEVSSLDNIAGFNVYRDSKQVNEEKNMVENLSVIASHNNNLANYIFDNRTSYWTPGNNIYPSTLEITSPQVVRASRIVFQWYYNSPKDFNIWTWTNNSWKIIKEVRNNTQLIIDLYLNSIPFSDKLKIEFLSGPANIYLQELIIYESVLVKELNFTDNVLKNGEHLYQIQTITTHGLEAFSETLPVITNEKIPPASPKGFRVKEDWHKLILEWDANQENDLAGYDIYLGDCEKLLNQYLISNTLQFIHNITPGINEYHYTIVAVDINGNRSLPTAVNYKFAKLSPPKNITANRHERNVQLNWELLNNTNFEYCKIYRNGELLLTGNYYTGNYSLIASSYYMNNINYGPDRVRDYNPLTFWRPDWGDTKPYLEVTYQMPTHISIIQISWNDRKIPASYTISALINNRWVEILNLNSNNQCNLNIQLPETIVTTKLRLEIQNYNSLPELSKFICSDSYKLTNNITNYIDYNLSSGKYYYQFSSVSRIGLEGPKSTPVEIEIPSKDVEILAGDIYTVPYQPSIFDKVSIFANIRNSGEEDLSNVPVGIYIGDPQQGGKLITTLYTLNIRPGEKALLEYIWEPVDYLGNQVLYVIIDPDNLISEISETNNILSKNITIYDCPRFDAVINKIDSTQFPKLKLGVQVKDGLGNGIQGLTIGNFSLNENGVGQNINNLIDIVQTTNEKAKIDLVFVIDTSGSMLYEWDDMPIVIKNITETMSKSGINLEYKVYYLLGGIDCNPPIDKIRLVPNSEGLYFGIYNGQIITLTNLLFDVGECWGPGTAWIAKNYPWRDDAYRIIIPISDETCLGGDPEDNQDLESIAEASSLCIENKVEVYPFYGISYYQMEGALQTVINEMQTIAKATGGEAFCFKNAIQVVNCLTRVLSKKTVDYFIEYETIDKIKDGTIRDIDLNASYRSIKGSCRGQYQAPQEIFSDLVASRLELGSQTVENQVSLRGFISNYGAIASQNVKVQFFLGNPTNGGLLLEIKAIPEININTTEIIDIFINLVPGQHDIYMVIDPENKVVEGNENNNTTFINLKIEGSQKADLVVLDSEITLSTNYPYCGQLLEITSIIRNIGSSVGPINIALYQGNPQTDGKLLETKILANLGYLESQNLVWKVVLEHIPGIKEFYLVIDPLNYIDENNKNNNTAIKSINIVTRPIMGKITTDKLIYQAEENCLLNLTIENHMEVPWENGKAKLVLKDNNGKFIQDLVSYEIAYLSGNSYKIPGVWNESKAWNIGKLAPGKYFVCFQLFQMKDCFSETVVELTVAEHRSLNITLLTDKSVYAPQDKAVINVDTTNTSINTCLENIIQTIVIKDQSRNIIWSEGTLIPYLPISGSIAKTFYWPISNIQSGEYQIIVETNSDSELLWSETKIVTVDDKAILTGSLNVNPRHAKAGQTVVMNYTVYNRGNLGLNNIPVNILFINDSTQVVTKTVTQTHNLDLDGFINQNVDMTIDLPDSQYMVVLQTEVNGEITGLSSAALLVDSTPPVTAAELSNQRFIKDGVFYGALNSELTLTAVDNLSGVAETLLDIGAGFQPYTGPVAFPAEGKYTVRYKSIDRLGNEENVKELMVVIDETPPAAAIISPIDNQEVAPEFIVNLTASDNVGLDYFELYINDQKFAIYNVTPVEQILQLEPGIYILKVCAVDLAGYESWSAPVNIKVQKADTTPPVTIAEYPADWTNQDATVILTATDDLSGVKETRYRVDGGLWQAGTLLQIITEGIHAIEFYSIDNAGNAEIVKSITVRLDRTKPVTEIQLTGDQKPDGSYQSNVTVNITAIDNLNGSGINRIYYRIGVEGGYQPYTEPLVITTEGLNEAYAYAVDNAGNHEEPQRVEFKIGKGWQSDYSLICNKLTIYGHLNVDRVFVNGPVNIYGHCNLNYLGTTEKTILKTGPSTIDLLKTEQPRQAIPVPDWEGLKKVTMLRQEKQIPKDVSLNNVRFENSLMIAGTTKLSGLIVVKGDLTINGNVDLNDAGIFCSGKITFNGNVQGSGLIYATGLTAHGNPQINGMVIVNGSVEASGSVGNNGVDLQKYLKWLK